MGNWLSKSLSIDFKSDQYFNDNNENVSSKKNYANNIEYVCIAFGQRKLYVTIIVVGQLYPIHW